MDASPTAFGPNEPQVLWVRDALASFSLDDWSALEAASEGPFGPHREKVYDAVKDVIDRHDGKRFAFNAALGPEVSDVDVAEVDAIVESFEFSTP